MAICGRPSPLQAFSIYPGALISAFLYLDLDPFLIERSQRPAPLLYNGALLPWFVTATFTRWR
jgi:hypothetical protein